MRPTHMRPQVRLTWHGTWADGVLSKRAVLILVTANKMSDNGWSEDPTAGFTQCTGIQTHTRVRNRHRGSGAPPDVVQELAVVETVVVGGVALCVVAGGEHLGVGVGGCTV